MDAQQGSVQVDNSQMGCTPDRLVLHTSKPSGEDVRLSMQRGQSGHIRCPPYNMGIRPSLCIPSMESTAGGHKKDKGRRGKSSTDSHILAQEAMVFVAQSDVNFRPLDSASDQRPSISGAVPTSSSKRNELDCLEFERQLLELRGFSRGLINTLMRSRKPSTTSIYVRIWKKFLEFHTAQLSSEVPIFSILEFLQKGLDLGLSVSTLKVQISALGALFNSDVAGNRWISRFISACERSKPIKVPQIPQWDLTLVLDALTQSPFEPLQTASLKHVSLKTILLVALVSARRVSDLHALSVDPPFLSVTSDRIVLKTDPCYLPKVATSFHRSQEILLPTFYENHSTPEEARLHTLDVKRAILTYIERTKDWRESRALFVSFQGKNKGSRVTKCTLSRWIRDAIILAYRSKGRDPPLHIGAHSTRAVSTSWAERANVPIHLICKAATWSSPNTFYKHYRLDLSAASDLTFGVSVLGSVNPPNL
ncbi:uncharacterized protein LOC143767393 [Ranitomeya variabilis]|uniref:uncharacterized protein LOC143767393 n=1 Tax=Ranitomeya variabilis TaxID=490064 RepID=UPI004057CB09